MVTPTVDLRRSLDYIRSRTQLQPDTALVLGSGLGEFADTFEDKFAIPTAEIPGYPRSTVPGHKGHIVFGNIGNRAVVAFQGRVHFYECGVLDAVRHPVRVANGLGATTLVVTNAAGGINREYLPGDLMLITDQLNFTGLSGAPPAPPSNERRRLYDREALTVADQVASEIGISLHHGVYAGVLGPSYETAAEVEMLHRGGADAVGMSTVLEVELAASLGMRVLGISCITNKATGVGIHKLNHDEVTLVARRVKEDFTRFLSTLTTRL